MCIFIIPYFCVICEVGYFIYINREMETMHNHIKENYYDSPSEFQNINLVVSQNNYLSLEDFNSWVQILT